MSQVLYFRLRHKPPKFFNLLLRALCDLSRIHVFARTEQSSLISARSRPLPRSLHLTDAFLLPDNIGTSLAIGEKYICHLNHKSNVSIRFIVPSHLPSKLSLRNHCPFSSASHRIFIVLDTPVINMIALLQVYARM